MKREFVNQALMYAIVSMIVFASMPVLTYLA